MNFKPMDDEQVAQCWKDLGFVTTIAEASVLWNICPGTLQNWVNEGIVVATQSPHCKVWLISTRSMIHRCGFPSCAPDHVR